tara:strand:+ start:471 stop:929 length:459 start_codon:yes stop_codon:yes gene_type:complete
MTFTVKNVDWGKDKHKLRKLRNKIFVCHWRIPQEYEFDQQDKDAYHVLVVDENNQDVATGRITEQGEIGRIAVEPQHRGPEVYQLLFNALICIAQQHGLHSVNVLCELEGVEHYQQQGFQPVGPVFMDAGIARQSMACSVANFSLNNVEFTH